MSKTFAVVGVVISTWWLTACGGDTDGVVDKEKMNADLRGLAGVICAKVFSCCTQAERNFRPYFDSTERYCASSLGGHLEREAGFRDIGGAKGRTRYRPDMLAICQSKVAARVCDDTRGYEVIPECRLYFEPLVAAGGACSSDYSCIDGSCVGADGSGRDLGTCQPLVSNGGACGSNDDCWDGYCSGPKPKTCKRPSNPAHDIVQVRGICTGVADPSQGPLP